MKEKSINKILKNKHQCKHCGYQHESRFCKFKKFECRHSGKVGHLEKVCRAKKNNENQAFGQLLQTSRYQKTNYKKNQVKNILEVESEEEKILKIEATDSLNINKISPFIKTFDINGKNYFLKLIWEHV